MPTRSNEIGNRGEEQARRLLQGETVKQSGGGKFWKSDIRDKLRMIWEVKTTDKDGFRVTKDMLLKARSAARGMKGSGDNFRPGMIVIIGDTAFAITELPDWVEINTADPDTSPRLAPSKAAERRAASRRSFLG